MAGLAMVVVSLGNVNPNGDDKYFWLSILILGVICTLAGGIAWSHMPGKRRWKTAFLGLAGCPMGAALGGIIAHELAEASTRLSLNGEIWSLLIGSWVGAILFACLGVWWGIAITRRLERNAGVAENSKKAGEA